MQRTPSRANARKRTSCTPLSPIPIPHVVVSSSSSSSFPFAPWVPPPCVCVCVCVCALHVHPMQRHALSPPARVHAFFHSSLHACVCMLGMLCPPPPPFQGPSLPFVPAMQCIHCSTPFLFLVSCFLLHQPGSCRCMCSANEHATQPGMNKEHMLVEEERWGEREQWALCGVCVHGGGWL